MMLLNEWIMDGGRLSKLSISQVVLRVYSIEDY